MLKNIIFTFPDNTASARRFFENLNELLGQLPNATTTDMSIEMRAFAPADSLPATILRQADVAFPQLHFASDDGNQERLSVGNLQINPAESNAKPIIGEPFAVAEKQDSLGTYYEIQPASLQLSRLPIEELCSRLKGHIVRIDHTGINLPTALISRTQWEQFVHHIASQANMYKYPTGEDWPFILPATAQEYTNEITQFPGGREPKFEMVYDLHSPVPTIQIDIETDLERKEIERLFPEPYGVSFPDVADYFRSVHVHHEWPGLDIRFDLRFKNNEPNGVWETGEWLVTDGGRIV